jgi:predicted chitinase
MRVEKRVLTSLGVSDARADRYLPDLNELLPRHGIDTPLRVAHFLAQITHESGHMSVVHENLRYRAEGLLRVFKKYFTPAEAQAFAGRPEAIANRVYANRMGNGPETSGDGFRYHGRGLLQTTGKDNYRRLAKFLDVDVVKSPDRVAEDFAVHSAVFYWSDRRINGPADRDDVKAVTQSVNGGVIGLSDRMMLLDRAKAALQVSAAPALLEGASHEVTATELNLRSAPEVVPATRLASLPQGTAVAVLGDAEEPGWVRVRVALNGQLAEGFVKSEHLQPIARARGARSAPAARPRALALPAVHLREGRRDVTRARDEGRAFPLGEPAMPRRTASRAEAKAEQLLGIVRYLDVEKRSHARYGPKTTATYCNIYAYDYCYLAHVYLPRVFWTRPAIQQLAASQQVPVRYGDTVRELNANALHDWLADYGLDFGWARVMDLDLLQAAANNGDVCLMVAKRADLNRSGHIVAVVPEHSGAAAARNATGEVLRAVESQAGVTNHRIIVKPTAWWRDPRFQAFSFWRHA